MTQLQNPNRFPQETFGSCIRGVPESTVDFILRHARLPWQVEAFPRTFSENHSMFALGKNTFPKCGIKILLGIKISKSMLVDFIGFWGILQKFEVDL